MGSEGWEEGESEEEAADGGASQQTREEERQEEEKEEVIFEMQDEAENAEGKMPCEPPSFHSPAKKKRRDDSESLRPPKLPTSSASC